MKKISALLAVPFLAVSLAACGGSDGGNVSKEQFVDGFTKALSEAGGVDVSGENAESIKRYGGCVYDEIKDDVSGDTLKAIADGDTEKNISKDDRDTLTESVQKCSQELIGDLDGGSSQSD
ncbi:MAG: hypothetical protein Q3979_04590 [Actinomycetaceae bacterium]|nr:hypothetical protein [Actinomycetaceae bacterium]